MTRGIRDNSDRDRDGNPGSDYRWQNPNLAARTLIFGHTLIFYFRSAAGKARLRGTGQCSRTTLESERTTNNGPRSAERDRLAPSSTTFPRMPYREATCPCGQLRLKVTGEPFAVSICNCLACKRGTGSA
jgi:hypothetical protein